VALVIRGIHPVIGSQRNSLIVIFIAWAAAQLLAFLFFGVAISTDSIAYIDGARNMLNGTLPAGYIAWYSSYCLLIAITMMIGAAPAYVVALQLMLSALATWSVYKITFYLSENRLSAFVAAILFATWPDLQQWNFLVYTDSPFTSMVLITVAAIIYRRNYILVLALIIFTVFLRPPGVVFLAACLVFLRFRNRSLYLLAALFLILLFANYVMKDYADDFLESYASATIIYPDESLGVESPANLYMPGSEYPPLLRPVLFALGNPLYFIKISSVKCFLFVGHVKPYFSVIHNTLIVVFLWPLYFLAVIGFRSTKPSALRSFIAVFMILQVVMVSITSENWDGRFLLPVLPWVFMLSSIAIARWKR
jgi:hypothetical protein